MDKGAIPKIGWQPDGSLHVDVPCGQIFAFSNFTVLYRGSNYEKVAVILNNNGLCPQS